MTTLVIEHKTSSEDIGRGSVFWQRLTMGVQPSQYLVGARALGYAPDGVLFDVLRKPALRPYEPGKARAAAEGPYAYGERCLAAIAERPDYYYQRGVVVRLEEEERDAAHDAWQTAEQIRASRNSGRWPRNTDACDAYHRMCDYFPVCSGQAQESDLRYVRGEAHPELGDARRHLPLLTASSARSYRSCPRKYQMAYEKGIRARVPAGALSFGTMIHAALEEWMRTRDLGAALRALAPPGSSDLCYSETVTPTTGLGSSHQEELGPLLLRDGSAADPYDVAKAWAMISGYHVRWADEPMEVLAVEREFRAPLVNPDTGAASRTWELGGKVDGVVRVP